MKKILLFIITTLFWFQSQSQTILTEGFEGASFPPTGWAATNYGSGNNWGSSSTYYYSGTKSAYYPFHSTNPADAWLFTKALSLTAGTTYQITFWERVYSSTYTEKLKVTVGNGQTKSAQTTTLADYPDLKNTTFEQKTITYTPSTSGTYYFAFNCYSAANQWNLYVDDVEIKALASAPANDNCSGAVNVAVNTNNTCSLTTSGTSVNATQSQSGCTGTADDDVWYKFTATAASHTVKVTPGTMSDVVFQVFSGTCASLSSLVCRDGTSGSNPEEYTLTGLNIGNTYYMRVYSYFTTGQGTFDICINTPNTSCPEGLGSYVNITVPYSATGLTNCGKGNDLNSTNVSPICNSSFYYGGEDEVYIFTPTNSGEYTISFTSGSSWVGIMLYVGCPLSGNGASCVGYAQSSSGNQTITATLTSGTTYYLIVDSYPTPNCHPSYNLSILRNPCSSITTITCDELKTENFEGTGLWSSSACSSSTPGMEKIFSFTPTVTGAYELEVTYSASSSQWIDYQWKAASGGCNSSGWTCIDDISTAGTYPIGTLTAGTQYYILLDPEGTTFRTQSFKIKCLPTTNTFTGTGNWSDVARWSGGAPPACSENAKIGAGANCTVNTAATVADLTVEGTLSMSGNSLTVGCGSSGGSSTFRITGAGDFEISAGTLTINGRFDMDNSGSFAQSGGDIYVDPNTGTAGTSLPSGQDVIHMHGASGSLDLNGGTITIVDPPYSGTGKSFNYTSASGVGYSASGTHKVVLGGSSSTPGGTPFELKTNGTNSAFAFHDLTVSGGTAANRYGSTLSTNATVTVKNKMTIDANSKFVVGSTGILNIADELENSGILTTTGTLAAQSWDVNGNTALAAPGAVLMSGTGTYRNAESGNNANTVNFTNNATGGTSFTGLTDFHASGTLNLTLGIIDMNSGTFTLGTSVSNPGTLTGGSTASYIDGSFKRWVNAAAGSRLFPVGTAAKYYPANINYTSAPNGGTLTASFIEGDAGSAGLPLVDGTGSDPYANTLCLTGYWEVLAADGLSTGTYTGSFTGTGFPCVTNYQTVRLIKRADAGSDWALAGTYATGTGSNGTPTANRAGLTGFSQFGISQGQNAPLPVELTKFSGTARNKTNILSWETASELNSDHFVLQRSATTDSESFEALGTVKAAGQSLQTNTYQFTDEQPLPVSYYRLKAVDFDGSFEYSKIIVLKNNDVQNDHVSVYPIPAHHAVNFVIQSTQDNDVLISITDLNGKVVKQQKLTVEKGANNHEVNIDDLPAGMYQATITGTAINSNLRIIKH